MPVEKDKPYPFSYKRLVIESRPEIGYVILGLIAACVNGSIMPIFAIIYSEIVATFQKPDPAVCHNLFVIIFKFGIYILSRM